MLSFRVYILRSHFAAIGRRVKLTESIAAHHGFLLGGGTTITMLIE